MGPLDFLFHVAGLFAPAAAVALPVSCLARWVGPKDVPPPPWIASFLLNFSAGAVVLSAGLLLSGRDGRMLTYAALVLACATSQWLLSRSWRG